MNNGLFFVEELNTINDNRLKEIKNYALYEHKNYVEKTKPYQCVIHQIVNCHSKSKKEPNKILKPMIGLARPLENYIIYKANSKSFPLNNDTEKIFFMCCGIFPNDEKFLNTLAEHDFLNIFDEFIETYFYIDEKYKNNETLSKMQKYMQYKRLMKVCNNQIVEIQNYFSKFHCITDINLIINKLLQIRYFNFELYNSYVTTNEDKKANQKVNKIG